MGKNELIILRIISQHFFFFNNLPSQLYNMSFYNANAVAQFPNSSQATEVIRCWHSQQQALDKLIIPPELAAVTACNK